MKDEIPVIREPKVDHDIPVVDDTLLNIRALAETLEPEVDVLKRVK